MMNARFWIIFSIVFQFFSMFSSDITTRSILPLDALNLITSGLEHKEFMSFLLTNKFFRGIGAEKLDTEALFYNRVIHDIKRNHYCPEQGSFLNLNQDDYEKVFCENYALYISFFEYSDDFSEYSDNKKSDKFEIIENHLPPFFENSPQHIIQRNVRLKDSQLNLHPQIDCIIDIPLFALEIAHERLNYSLHVLQNFPRENNVKICFKSDLENMDSPSDALKKAYILKLILGGLLDLDVLLGLAERKFVIEFPYGESMVMDEIETNFFDKVLNEPRIAKIFLPLSLSLETNNVKKFSSSPCIEPMYHFLLSFPEAIRQNLMLPTTIDYCFHKGLMHDIMQH